VLAWGAQIRCFFRDPAGHLLEISIEPHTILVKAVALRRDGT
jgi:hypothetical protein